MKRIKALTIGLILTMAGAVYAAGGGAQQQQQQQQSAAEACDMNMDGESCCTHGASCCTGGGGSCCTVKVAQKQ